MVDKKTKKAVVSLAQGNGTVLSINDLETIVKLSKKYEVDAIKLSKSGKVTFLGAEPEMMQQLQLECGITSQHLDRNNKIAGIHACPGKKHCTFGVAETTNLAQKLEQISFEKPLPAKVKVGISGCRRCCSQSWIRDIGLIAEPKGWKFIFGGNGAGNPRIGDIIAKEMVEEQIFEAVMKALHLYRLHAKPAMRTARFMTAANLEKLCAAVSVDNNHAKMDK
jgi:NAD(P)H-nitrite reductase large subunit